MQQLFRHPDFRRLFFGRLVTNAGDSLYTVAAMWLVYSLSGSTFFTGLAGVLTMGPGALQALAGPLVDRWPLRRTLVLTQALQGLLVLTIPLAHWLGLLSVWVVLAVMPLVSLLNQFVYPAQTAALPRVVEAEELTEANAAFSVAYQGVDMAFNAVAGLLVAAVGAVSLYLIDSVSFAVAVALFAGLQVPPADPQAGAGTVDPPIADAAQVAPAPGEELASDGGTDPVATTKLVDPPTLGESLAAYRSDLSEGFRFVRRSVMVWFLGAGLLANALLGATMAVLPAFADGRGGAGTYGFLLAGIAGGVFLGALVFSQLDRIPYGRLTMVGFTAGAVAWFGALAVESTPLTVGLFALAFVPIGATNVLAMTAIQRMVPEDLLGRVAAVAGSASVAIMPLGSLLGGAAGDIFGPDPVMVAAGAGFLWIVVYVAAVKPLRRMPAPLDVEPIPRDVIDG